jgi:cyclopropane fatty-acyl-phospholipid synthase-like methyltransferase
MLPDVHGVGLDISPSSKYFAEWQLAVFGVENRYELLLQDLTVNQPSTKVEWMVCVEVLEHLDDPVSFLRSLRKCMSSESKAFVTAAVNAAHADHIYLYKNADAVLAHLHEAGFTMEQSFVGAAYKPIASGSPVPQAAAFIVY